MLTIASCLAKRNDVKIFWDEASILKMAGKRLGIDLTKVKVVKNIFSSKVSLVHRLIATKRYDCIVYLSDGSLPVVLSRKLIVHFQFPVEWVFAKNILTKLKLTQVSRIICNSAFTKGFIDRKFGIESTVLYPPVDLGKKIDSNKENVILTVGRFGRLPQGKNFKKQDVMIAVFKKMVDGSLKNCKFFVVVSFAKKDEDELKKLEQQIKGYPIIIVKNASHKVLAELYKEAKLYWHAAGFGEDLTVHPERAEHFGISTVEAMGAGVLPLVFNGGGQREIVSDGENGFLWNTLDECIEKTKNVLENEPLRLKLSKEAQKRAKDFSEERFCKELYEIIET